jgi:hypothetical protein
VTVRTLVAIVMVSAAGLTGCASIPAPDRQASASPVPANGPQVSWEIRSGGEFGDARTICSSADAKPDCTLAAQRDGGRNLATVRVYLHAAERQTRYLGSVEAPFVPGSDRGRLGEINTTVPSNSSPVGATLNGLVTDQPGVYRLEIALDAVQAGEALPTRLARNVPVTVVVTATP